MCNKPLPFCNKLQLLINYLSSLDGSAFRHALKGCVFLEYVSMYIVMYVNRGVRVDEGYCGPSQSEGG